MNTRISNQEKLNLLDTMKVMLAAGIPIAEIIDSLFKESSGNLKTVLQKLKADIGQGKTMADSLSYFPNSFDPVTINMIRAAEEAGTLEQTLAMLRESTESEIEFSDKIKAALAYPAVILMVFSAVIILILTYVIPRITVVLVRLKIELPLPTRILIAMSQFLLAYTVYIVIGFIILAVGAYFLYQKKRKLLYSIIFSLPLISGIQIGVDLNRFCKSMALMLSSGIPVIEALNFSEQVVSRNDLSLAITQAKTALSAGKEFSQGLKTSPTIPSIVIHIVEAGEKSGTLDKSMQELAEHFEYEVSNKLKSFTALLEPILMVFIGLTIGGIMITIIAPIYQMISNIRPY